MKTCNDCKISLQIVHFIRELLILVMLVCNQDVKSVQQKIEDSIINLTSLCVGNLNLQKTNIVT